MNVRLSWGLAAVLAIMPLPLAADPLATADVHVYALAVDVDTRPDIDGIQYEMTAVKDVPAGVRTVVGAPGVSIDVSAGALVKAELFGPGVATEGVTLAAPPNELLEFPRLAVSGQYYLTGVRLVDALGVTLLERDPTLDTITIEVIDEILVTQVSSRALSAEEIEEAGIIVDEDNFTAVSFTVGMAFGSEEVEVELPVLVPTPGSDRLTPPPALPAVTLRGPTTTGFQTVPIPNLALSGFSLQSPPEQEIPGIELPPINGVVVIPGDIAFLNQFFSVMVLTTNVAAEGSGLVVHNASASIHLPAGEDGALDTGDDPLAMAEVAGGGNELVQTLLDSGGNDSILPGGTNQAEYLVEGLREGTHRLDLDISGDLYVPSLGESFPISGVAAGIVQVRNPTFALILAHPQTVREGEEYSVFVTVTNTSTSPANYFQLQLNSRSLSGARLVEDESDTHSLESLLPGEAETFEYRLEARITGEVTGTVFLADPSINGSFVLNTGVGDAGIPLSPDTLVLPQTVDYLPDDPDIVFAYVRQLGMAYSVATAPAGTLPPDVGRISKSFVFDRAVKLAQVGLHARFGESVLDGAMDLLMDFAGADTSRLAELLATDPENPTTEEQSTIEAARRDLAAFDGLRRSTGAGRGVSEALGLLIGRSTESGTLADAQWSWAERFASRPAHLSVVVETNGGRAYSCVTDDAGAATGRLFPSNELSRELPYSAHLPLAEESDRFAEMLLVTATSSSQYDIEFMLDQAAETEVSLVVPFGEGMAQVTYARVDLPAGSNGRVVWEAGTGGPFDLEFDTDGDGVVDAVLSPVAVDAVDDPAPSVVGAHLWGKGALPQLPITFAAGDPLGRLLGVLFSEEVTEQSAGTAANYAIDENAITGVQLQPDNRLVFVTLDKPVGPFVSRSIEMSGVEDRRGNATEQATSPIISDPDRGTGGIVEGVVRSPDGTPIPFATLKYLQRVNCWGCDYGLGSMDYREISTYVADVNGHYQIDFVLQNALAQGALFKLVVVDPLTGNPGEAATRVHYDGQRMRLDVIVRGFGSIVGYVYEEDGTPVVGGDPNAADALRVFAKNISTGGSAAAWVDENGYYAFPREFAADNSLDAPELPVGNILVKVVQPSDASRAIATTNIPAAGAVVKRDLVLLPVNRFGTITGRVVESDGETPARDVLVQAAALGAIGLPAIDAVTTDENGEFLFEDVAAGNVELQAFRQETYEIARAATYLAESEDKTITLVLPGVGAGMIRGFVLDGVGVPVAGATVAGGPTLTSADDNGYFEIPNIPVGTYQVYGQAADSLATGSAQVTIPSDDAIVDVIVRLQPVGTIAGTVYQADETTVVPGQEVQLWTSGPSGTGVMARVFTDTNGTFEFISYPVGAYSVRAVVSDYGDGGQANTEIRYAGDMRDADIVFRGLGEVKGRVLQQPDKTPMIAYIILTRQVWRVLTQGGSTEVDQILEQLEENLNNAGPIGERLAGILGRELASVPTTFYQLQYEPTFLQSGIRGSGGEVTGEFHYTGPITGGSFSIQANNPLTTPTYVSGEIPRSTDPADRVVDVGDIVLEPSTGEVMGTVFMPDGVTPVGEGVQVVARGLELDDITAETDEDGLFHLPLVVAGATTLRADTLAPDVPALSAAKMQTEVFGALNVRLYGSTNVSVPAGETVPVDIRLLDVAEVQISVVEADGVTAVDAPQVSLRTSSILDAAEEPELIGLYANASGTISMFPVIEGRFSVFAQEQGGPRSGSVSGTVGQNPDNGHVIPVTITLGAVTTEQGDVVETEVFGTVQGTVFKADGTALSNPAEVTIRAQDAHFLTTSDELGFYSVDYVPGGWFSVNVFEPFTARTGAASGSIQTDGQVVDRPVTLVGLGSVAGRVLSADGDSSIPGAEVTLVPSGNFSGRMVSTTDTLGVYSMAGVPLGPYQVRVQEPVSELEGSATGQMAGDNDHNTTDVYLEPSGSIVGTVFSAGVLLIDGVPSYPDGTPWSNAPTEASASVDLWSRSELVRTVQTDADGVFDSGPYLLLGDYSLVARPAVGDDGGTGATILAYEGHIAEVSLALRGQGEVSGVVLDSSGEEPIQQASVVLVSTGFSSGPLTYTTPADGTFSFPEVPVGSFSISVVTNLQTPELGASVSGVLSSHGDAIAFLDNDADTDHDAIWLQEAGQVEGVVLLDDRVTPAKGAIVELSGGGILLSDLSDADGQFAFVGLPLGTYLLSILEPASNGVASGQVTLAKNGDVVDLGGIVVDSEAPAVTAVTPAPDAIDVSPETSIVVTLSEAVDPHTVTADTFSVSISGSPVAGSLQVSSAEPAIEFFPNAPLPDLTSVTVAVRGDVLGFENQVLEPGIRDLAGLSLSTDTVFSFTTADSTGPWVVSVSPEDGATEVSVNTVVRIELSEAIDPTSIASFELTTGGAVVASTNSLALGDRVAILVPDQQLATDTTYAATLTGPVTDWVGNPADATEISTTFATIDTLGPSVTSLELAPDAVPIFGATVQVIASVDDGADTAVVEFTVAGELAATDTSAPFAFDVYMDPALGSSISLVAAAVDPYGNRGSTSSLTIEPAANQSPAASLLLPATSNVSPGDTVAVLVEGTDDVGVSQVSFTANDGGAGSGAFTVSPTTLTAQHQFSFVVPADLAIGTEVVVRGIATDILGLTAPATAENTVTLTVVDTDPPNVAIGSPAAGAYVDPGDTLTVFVQASDASGIAEIQLDTSGAVVSNDSQLFDPVESSGGATFGVLVPAGTSPTQTLELLATAQDGAGNTATSQLLVGIADRNPPAIELTAPGGLAVEPSAVVLVEATVTDEVGVTSVDLTAGDSFADSQELVPAETDAVVPFYVAIPEGLALGETFEVSGSAEDTFANVATATPLTLTIADFTSPVVAVHKPSDGTLLEPNSTVQVRAVASDKFDLASFSLSVSGAVTASDSATVNLSGTDAVDAEWLTSFDVPATATANGMVLISVTATDSSGNPGTSATVTALVRDYEPPVVAGVFPSDGATDVSAATDIVVSFSEAMDPATLTASNVVLSSASETVAGTYTAINGDTQLQILPDDNLEFTTEYTLSVGMGVTDAAGNALAAVFESTFTTYTPDTSPPEVIALNPLDAATGVQIYAPVEVIFSEPIEDATVTESSFIVATGGVPVPGSLVFLDGDTRVRFLPSSAFATETPYEVTVTTDITDLVGTPLAESAVSTFTTVGQANVDTDLDGVRDAVENQLGTDPAVYDDFPNLTVVIDGRTAILDDALLLGGLTLVNGAVVTHSSATTSTTYALNLTLIDTLSIDATSAIDVSGKGYLGGRQGDNADDSGRTLGNAFGAGPRMGGTYGGLGGPDSSTGDAPALSDAYGDLKDPNDLGSGGGAYSDGYYEDFGGNGGGIARITATSIQLAGAIRADGGAAGYSSGGGSGGSILVQTDVLTGSGSISVQGSDGWSGGFPGGGGGRVAVYYDDDDGFTGTYDATGGSSTVKSRVGGAGTVFTKSANQTYGDLTVDNTGNSIRHQSTVLPTTGASYQLDGVIIQGNGSLYAVDSLELTTTTLELTGYFGSTIAAPNLTELTLTNNTSADVEAASLSTLTVTAGASTLWGLEAGTLDSVTATNATLALVDPLSANTVALSSNAVLTHPGATTSTEYGLTLEAGALSIDESSSIDVSGKGYLGGRRGDNADDSGRTLGNAFGAGPRMGGTYGGLGGPDTSDPYPSPAPSDAYGDFKDPNCLGSGGGANMDGKYNAFGGNGGGIARITAISIQLAGAIRADGDAAADYSAGGSGGSILVRTNTLTGSGSVSAQGGAGSSGGYPGGGGGRIAVYYTDDSDFTGSYDAVGGSSTAARDGGAGTIFTKSAAQTYGNLVVDNGGMIPAYQSTPLRAIGSRVSTSLSAQAMGDTLASFRVPENGDIGLLGLQLDPGGGVTYTVVGNDATQLFTDSADGDMTLTATVGATYLGVYTFDDVVVTGGAQVVTGDNMIIQSTVSVDDDSRLESLNLSLP